MEITKYVLPLLIGVIPMLVIVILQMRQQSDTMLLFNRREALSTRLMAYERLALLLERTKPEALVMRADINGQSVIQLQQFLLTSIREEFDHNLSQQIYVSAELWDLIEQTRENIVKLINTLAIQTQSNEEAIVFAKRLVASYGAVDVTPTDVALSYLKQEVNKII